MDGTPTSHNNDSNARNGASPSATGNAKASDENVPQEHTGPFIIGSPIDLGDIDNVDNIGIRLDPVVRSGSRCAREHIELQETGLPECDPSGESSESINRGSLIAHARKTGESSEQGITPLRVGRSVISKLEFHRKSIFHAEG
jgi:hypothetical protein